MCRRVLSERCAGRLEGPELMRKPLGGVTYITEGRCRMRVRASGSLLLLALTAVLGCQDNAAPDTLLAISGPPDLTAAVFRSTHEEFISPVGPISQYAVWIGLPAGSRPDAGVLVGKTTPVFLRINGGLSQTTGASIRAGDLIQVWRKASVAYGAVQAPPGAPCYQATQIVIER